MSGRALHFWRLAAASFVVVGTQLVLANGTIETFVGDYSPAEDIPALEAPLDPVSLAVNDTGTVFVASTRRVFRIEPGGQIFVTAGNGGPAVGAQLNRPTDVYVDTYPGWK